jgi:hypothetical protein
LLVEAQLSPALLCDEQKHVADTRVRFLVRLDPLRGPLVVDVMREGSRIYQGTLREFIRLRGKLSPNEMFQELRQQTFFSAADFNEIPGGGLLSLRDGPANRLPASSASPTASASPVQKNH